MRERTDTAGVGGECVVWAHRLRPRAGTAGTVPVWGSGGGLSLRLCRGEVCAVVGPPGSGTSLLVACLAGLAKPVSGEVWVAGRRLDDLGPRQRAALRRTVLGVVPREAALVPELTAVENVALPLLAAGRTAREKATAAARGWLRRVDAEDWADEPAGALDTVAVRRIALARALAGTPRALLADDPTAGLDRVEGDRLLRMLRAAGASHGIAVLVASATDAVLPHADRHVALAPDPGGEPAPTTVDGAAVRIPGQGRRLAGGAAEEGVAAADGGAR